MLNKLSLIACFLLVANFVQATNNPILQDDYFVLNEGEILEGNVMLNDLDPEGDLMVPVISVQPQYGGAIIDSKGNFSYLPKETFKGKDQFSYRVYEENGGEAEAKVHISSTTKVCVTTKVYVYLEGAFDETSGLMKTRLNKADLLPGMDKAKEVKPYAGVPWNYGFHAYDAPSVLQKNNYSDAIVDWLLVSLLDEKFNPIIRATAMLQNDGEIIFPKDCFPKLDPQQKVYIKIEHRNHTSVISNKLVALKDGQLSYDFREQDSALTQEKQQKLLNSGQWVMYAGNGFQKADAFNSIDNRDQRIWSESNGSFNIYSNADFNLDGDVNIQDKILWFNNQK